MIHRLNIFDHIIFHIDSDPLHCTAAIQDKNNSGADVQIANIVSQISKSDTLKCLAILTLVFIRWFAENTNKYNQMINTIVDRSINFYIYVKTSYSSILNKKNKLIHLACFL